MKKNVNYSNFWVAMDVFAFVCLTRRKLGGINDFISLLDQLLVGMRIKGGSRQSSHTGSSQFQNTKGLQKLDEVGDTLGLSTKLDNAVTIGDICDLSTKLMAQRSDCLQMFVLVTQSLGRSNVIGVEATGTRTRSRSALRNSILVHLAVMLEEFLKELGTEKRNLGQQKFTLHEGSVSVVEDSPDRYKIFNLATSLLDDSVQTVQDNSHTRQILNLGVGDNKGVDIESTSG